MELVKKYQAIYLRGNHEQYFLEFMNSPEDWFPSYLYNGGKETIESLLHKGATDEYSPTEIAMMIRSRYKDMLNFLAERPFYYEWGNYVFVHAGVDLTKDWKETSLQDFLWIREPFHEGKKITSAEMLQMLQKQLYLFILLHQCYMEICKRQPFGNLMEKSELMVEQSLAELCTGWFLIKMALFMITKSLIRTDHGNQIFNVQKDSTIIEVTILYH